VAAVNETMTTRSSCATNHGAACAHGTFNRRSHRFRDDLFNARVLVFGTTTDGIDRIHPRLQHQRTTATEITSDTIVLPNSAPPFGMAFDAAGNIWAANGLNYMVVSP
jgi:hypothetical protein